MATPPVFECWTMLHKEKVRKIICHSQIVSHESEMRNFREVFLHQKLFRPKKSWRTHFLSVRVWSWWPQKLATACVNQCPNLVAIETKNAKKVFASSLVVVKVKPMHLCMKSKWRPIEACKFLNMFASTSGGKKRWGRGVVNCISSFPRQSKTYFGFLKTKSVW